MTILEAIEARHSVRAYKEQPLTEDVVRVLEEKIECFNQEGKLHIQLVINEPKAFKGTLAKYGKFKNVSNYLVMAGKKSDDLDERVGYYGEHLVLLAQMLGLNTCWVGLSYSKVPGTFVLANDEKIASRAATINLKSLSCVSSFPVHCELTASFFASRSPFARASPSGCAHTAKDHGVSALLCDRPRCRRRRVRGALRGDDRRACRRLRQPAHSLPFARPLSSTGHILLSSSLGKEQ